MYFDLIPYSIDGVITILVFINALVVVAVDVDGFRAFSRRALRKKRTR